MKRVLARGAAIGNCHCGVCVRYKYRRLVFAVIALFAASLYNAERSLSRGSGDLCILRDGISEWSASGGCAPDGLINSQLAS
ncbi:hypothetical protein NLM27_43125 [Bradyrhizobium sp. CCGB12]|uniref:hypothetical protein n=1 Tax=Bradyrhizobium sp. CCGB12 TaxID=2949632 RepID=UPI0020B313DD|nr:hypothetical protein [Bradyrhizobium sp. CCGB12]MCP3395490.1 hypothetical protein [Bradyrhizobium sp. CCGB12]